MSTTISSSTTGPVVLGTADNPLYITSTGTVTSTGSADGIDGGAGTTWTITNAGVVSAVSGNGVSLASSGIVGNTGSISGKDALVLRAGGSVTNNVGGSISGLGALGAGLGSGAGVYITGAAGTVTNNSTISGVAYGVGLGHGGLVTNTSSITGGEDGVIVQGAIGTIANSGNIIATVDDGVGLFAGGSVTNASGASISGARHPRGRHLHHRRCRDGHECGQHRGTRPARGSFRGRRQCFERRVRVHFGTGRRRLLQEPGRDAHERGLYHRDRDGRHRHLSGERRQRHEHLDRDHHGPQVRRLSGGRFHHACELRQHLGGDL